MNTVEDKLHWEFGPLIMRDGACFGYGWVFHEIRKTQDVRLVVGSDAGAGCEVRAGIGKYRDNVAAIFPQYATALNSGFFLLGSCSHGPNISDDVHYRVTLEDGSIADLPVRPEIINSDEVGDVKADRISLRRLAGFLKRNLYLLKGLRLQEVLVKARNYFSNRPSSFLANAAALRITLDETELQNVVIVIDHDLGGGANHYRERMVADTIAEGKTVLILSCYLATLSPILIVRSKRRDERYTIQGYGLLHDLAGLIDIKEVILNTGVSFLHPEELPPLIAGLKNDRHTRLTLLVHEYFMVCPSHYLIDENGSHCGIPDIDRCRACLARNEQEFSSLYAPRDIVQWRALWGNVIGLADEVRFFSKESRNLFLRAYPALNPSRTVVKPHTMQQVVFGHVQPVNTASLRIGVVGNIGYHKGSGIVQQLAHEIKTRNLDIKIVVIGTVEAQCEESVVRQTGPYRHDELPELITSSGVNTILFPSICSETFSYVVQELVDLELPVACFDVGAPAERLRSYSKGKILNDTDAAAVLDQLIRFHQQVHLSN